jgi:hypothetical protein
MMVHRYKTRDFFSNTAKIEMNTLFGTFAKTLKISKNSLKAWIFFKYASAERSAIYSIFKLIYQKCEILYCAKIYKTVVWPSILYIAHT